MARLRLQISDMRLEKCPNSRFLANHKSLLDDLKSLIKPPHCGGEKKGDPANPESPSKCMRNSHFSYFT